MRHILKAFTRRPLSAGLSTLRWIIPVASLCAAASTQAQTPKSAPDGKLLFEQNCAACHLPNQLVVGPSMLEISKLYSKKPQEFLAWAKQPKKKRPGLIEMPSMVHLGDANLHAIREYIVSATVGLKEKAALTKDLFERPARRPEVRRAFIPDVGPAAIAVALPGDLSYCFDAGDCRLRIVWRGDFIDCWPHWKGNGSELAQIMGKILWQLPADEKPPAAKFHGYSVDKTGLPTFEYERDGVSFLETITGSGSTLTRSLRATANQPLSMTLDPTTTASAGKRSGNILTLTPAEAQSFTLTTTLPQ